MGISVDPDQTVVCYSRRAVCSGSTLFDIPDAILSGKATLFNI